MKKNITLFLLLTSIMTFAQVRMTGINISSVNSSAFIDGSSNPSNNSSVGTGKGLVFPRIDLSTFTFVSGTTGISNNFPTRYDGMIVYNTKDGGTANVGATEGLLKSGFWFYENKTASLTGGTWKQLSPTPSSTTIKGLVNCTGTITQTIAEASITATSSIYVTYEDTTGDIIYTSIKNRVAGTGFTVQFGAVPSTAAKINYIIVNN